jgi:hypothetical protein
MPKTKRKTSSNTKGAPRFQQHQGRRQVWQGRQEVALPSNIRPVGDARHSRRGPWRRWRAICDLMSVMSPLLL